MQTAPCSLVLEGGSFSLQTSPAPFARPERSPAFFVSSLFRSVPSDWYSGNWWLAITLPSHRPREWLGTARQRMSHGKRTQRILYLDIIGCKQYYRASKPARPRRKAFRLGGRNLSKVFGSQTQEQKVLSQISFSVADRSFTAIVGPSGCGKSTLVNIISGIEVASRGSITFSDGKESTEDVTVGYVFQSLRGCSTG